MKEYKTEGGEFFLDAANKAKERTLTGDECFFFFNGIKCVVNKETNIDDLYMWYDVAMTLGIAQIGPSLQKEIPKDLLNQFNETRKRQEWSKLSVDQITSFKKAAEQRMIQIISKFKEDTGLDIEKIHLTTIDPIVPMNKKLIIDIELEIHL